MVFMVKSYSFQPLAEMRDFWRALRHAKNVFQH